MCIRDRAEFDEILYTDLLPAEEDLKQAILTLREGDTWYRFCLLYTSDAADERSSVDLGGRRIIKKKNQVKVWEGPRKK